MLSFKSYTVIVLIGALLASLIPIVCLLVLDPLQIFHKPWIRDPYFLSDLRVQAAGIINNSDFDSIILGTSMAQNMSPLESSHLWDAKFVNISPSGSLLSERSIILNYALRKKNLKNIIVSLDGFAEYGTYKPDYSPDRFAFLYNRNRIDDLKIYLQRTYINYLFCGNIIFSSNDAPCGQAKDLENVTEWGSMNEHDRSFGGLDKWLAAKDLPQVLSSLEWIRKSTKVIKSGNLEEHKKKANAKGINNTRMVFDEYLLHFIEENPSSNFYFFFPPYPRITYAILEQSANAVFDLYLNKIRYIVSQLENFENASVYGFDHLEFPDDIANYKDTAHYHSRFDSAILKWMKNGEHRLTSKNVDTYIEKITELAQDYDVVSIGEIIEKDLNKKPVK